MKKTTMALVLVALFLVSVMGCAAKQPAQATEPPKSEATETKQEAAQPIAETKPEETAQADQPTEDASAAQTAEPVVLTCDMSEGDSIDTTTLTFDPVQKTVHVSAMAASIYTCEADLTYSVENGSIIIPEKEATAEMTEEAKSSVLSAFLPKELKALIWTEVEGTTMKMWFGDPNSTTDEPRSFGTYELTPEILAALGVQ